MPEAIKEWFFNGQSEDHDEPVATCELCNNHGLRYRYQIENRFNQNTLWVGSKCIERFHMPIRDENGILLDWPATRRKLNSLKRRREYESCVKALERVAAQESNSAILHNASSYYHEHKCLTPKFAFVVLWRLKVNRVDHAPQFFKVSLKRNKEKADLRDMPRHRVHLLWPALSPSQRQLAVRLGHCAPGDLPSGDSRG